MWESRRLLDRELFSYVTYGEPHPNHWWLAQVAFYGLYSFGGPRLLTLAAGACGFLALLSVWQLTRGCRGELRLALLLVSMLCLPAWSVRPQVFSMAFMAITIRLILADRLAWLPAVMVLWANTHAVVVLGIAVACLVPVETLLWSRHRIGRALAAALACAAAPMISPLGIHYWPYVLKVVREARVLGIQEYRSAFGIDVETVGLWLVVGALAVIAARHRSTLASRDRRKRVLLMASAVLAAAAIVSVRNEAFFALVAIPTFGRFAPHADTHARRPAPRPALALVAIATLATALGTAYRWRDGGAALGWKPLAPAAIEAIRTCPAPLYNAFGDGGALIWFVPEQRVFMDGRTDAYPVDFLLRATQAELRGQYKDLFTDYHIRCAVVGTRSRMARLLRRDPAMALRFTDARWAVFQTTPD
jgi:hypothetical protein